jgi:ankyrin repeat protein
MDLAAISDRIDVLRVLLEHDRSLGYLVTSDGFPLLNLAAYRGHVGVARELLKHCPDAPYTSTGDGSTCLHTAVSYQQTDFVDFVVRLPQLGRLVNMRDRYGDTALHLAVNKCNPKMVAALLLHPDIDVTVLNNSGGPAIWKLHGGTEHSKTLNWVCTVRCIYVFLIVSTYNFNYSTINQYLCQSSTHAKHLI